MNRAANLRQSRPEGQHAVVLRRVTRCAIPRMVQVLLAAPRVVSNGLNMAVIERTDPNVRPGQRNHQRLDFFERVLIADRLSVRADIIKAFAATLTHDSRSLIGDVPKMSGFGRGHGIICYCSMHSIGGTRSTRNCYKGAASLMQDSNPYCALETIPGLRENDKRLR